MAVVTFYGNGEIETAQTTSMACIATYLSFEKDYKILLINTKHNDHSLENCFWNQKEKESAKGDLESGITGLIKALASNKTSPEIITNYTKTIFKDRLELLTDDNMPREDYEKQREYMKNIVKIASKYYDLVFVDLEGNIEEMHVDDILKESNLIVANTSQRIKMIDNFLKNRRKCSAITDSNLICLIGKYDRFSKYNIKNLERTRRMPETYGIQYSTLLFEASNEGNLAEYIVKYRNVRETDLQAPVIEGITTVSTRIIEKLKELQMQVV